MEDITQRWAICPTCFASESENAVHHSGMLVRQVVDGGSFELLAYNADAHYRGKDMARAVISLSKVPEVVWCHAEEDLTQGDVRC